MLDEDGEERIDRSAANDAEAVAGLIGPLWRFGVGHDRNVLWGERFRGLSNEERVTGPANRWTIAWREWLFSTELVSEVNLWVAKQQLARITRVADVAAECGYWDFGRFASRYKTLFGELPSETLRS